MFRLLWCEAWSSVHVTLLVLTLALIWLQTSYNSRTLSLQPSGNIRVLSCKWCYPGGLFHYYATAWISELDSKTTSTTRSQWLHNRNWYRNVFATKITPLYTNAMTVCMSFPCCRKSICVQTNFHWLYHLLNIGTFKLRSSRQVVRQAISSVSVSDRISVWSQIYIYIYIYLLREAIYCPTSPKL